MDLPSKDTQLSGPETNTIVLWVQLLMRDAEDADEVSKSVGKLGHATSLDVPNVRVRNIDQLCAYIINYEIFKDRFADINPDQLYVYHDAECQTAL